MESRNPAREFADAQLPSAPVVYQAGVRLAEHDWLMRLYKEPANRHPRFRLADLLGACVSVVHGRVDLVCRLRAHLLSQLGSSTHPTNRRCDIFSAQYAQLLELHRAEWNTQPNPMFELDLLATSCVAVVSRLDQPYECLLAVARCNFRARSGLQEAH